MANWVVIENNVITEYYDAIPDNWRNISGFKRSAGNTIFMQSAGWYPVTPDNPVFDPDLQAVVSYSYNIDKANNVVYQIPNIIDLPSAQKITRAMRHKILMNRLEDRIIKILDKTDRTQMRDFVNTYGANTSDAWGQYRNDCRNLITTYANTNIIRMVDVVFPNVPFPDIPL